MNIRVAIIDDHPMVLSGLSNMLKPFTHIKIVGTYLNGTSFLESLDSIEPDVVLIDIMLPDQNGAALTKLIKSKRKFIKLLAVTSLNTPNHVKQMMKSGCSGYLLKNTDQQILVEAIEKVYLGEEYIEAKIKEQLLNSMLRTKQQFSATDESLPSLTRREKEILKLIIQENTNQQIADVLFLSLRTVENHRFNLQQKLKVNNLVGLIKVAIQLDLTE